jgi:glucose/arabinose dehydrogenase
MKSCQLLAVGALTAAVVVAQQPDVIPAGYTVETVATPDGHAFGVGGMSFAPDGRLFVSTREGQVWTYAGSTWTLFADGLHEPLGVYVDPRTSQVFCVQRPELTELIDADGDGRAERFRTVCAGWGLTDNYHEYAYGLLRDGDGNFYGTLNTSLSWPGWAGSDKWDVARVHDCKMGRAAAYRGWSFRVTPDGAFEPWSSGLRSPAGIGWGPNGELLCTDNQGDWVATSCLHVMERGDFHGHPSSLTDHPDYAGRDLNEISVEQYGELQRKPAVWFPHGDLANSPGEPVLDATGGKFGPFEGQLFCGDQTRSNVFRIVLERVGGRYQGCAINFVDHLQSGVVRARFATDGSLWVGQTGRGWGSRGPAKFGLQRVVWDGDTVPFELERVAASPSGFVVHFTRSADRARAAEPGSYRVQRWRYKHFPGYGSPKLDRGEVAVTGVQLADQGRAARLALPLEPGFVYQVTADVSAASGDALANPTAWYTLHAVPE